MRPLTLLSFTLLTAACSSDPSPTPDASTDARVDAASDASADVAADASDPTALTLTTTRGPVIGHVSEGVTAVLGVPYAAPPVGALRWRAPTEHATWTTPLDAATKGATCTQDRGMLSGSGPMSEDCLFLNVWTPKTRAADTTRRPVMVFVHGGGFTAGTTSGPEYDGANLAAKGVVVVTFNYRLGQFGFLGHTALTAEDTEHRSSGNYGFQDQQAVLRWVRDNAASFGGDPANVTLFGESAGSISVCAHMVAPGSAGLFHKAIGESAVCAFLITPLHDIPALPAVGSAEAQGRRFETAVGCTGMSDVAACMRSKTPAQVLAAAPTPVELSRYGVRYQPNIDGYVFTEAPWVSLLAGRFQRVPFITGTNRDEGTAFTLGVSIPTEAAYRALVMATLPDHVDDVMRLYPVAMYPTPKAAYEAFLRDAVFVCPARGMARLTADANVPTWLYHFTRENRAGMVLGLGVYHSAELPYVFGNFTGFFTRAAEDEPVVTATQNYWTRFATTGDPNGAGATMWPRFTTANDTHMEIGDMVRTGTGLRREVCDAMTTWLAPPR
jgi:para-nitrobenzyl esterase